MKERGLNCKGHEVRGIVSGRQTMIRRMVKLPVKDPQFGCEIAGCELNGILKDHPEVCPYGVVGDRLWVRETFADARAMWGKVFYRADDQTDHDSDGTWTPSIHMPRWASRITLEIVSIRVERLQEISEEDAKKEGVEAEPIFDTVSPQGWMSWIAAFARLWDSIYGNWYANPYVWVVEFRRVEQ